MTRVRIAALGVIVGACLIAALLALVQQRRRVHDLEAERDLYCLRLAEELEGATKAGDTKRLGVRMREHSLNLWTTEFCTGKPMPYRTELRDAAEACFFKANDPDVGDRCYLELATELAAAFRAGRNAR